MITIEAHNQNRAFLGWWRAEVVPPVGAMIKLNATGLCHEEVWETFAAFECLFEVTAVRYEYIPIYAYNRDCESRVFLTVRGVKE